MWLKCENIIIYLPRNIPHAYFLPLRGHGRNKLASSLEPDYQIIRFAIESLIRRKVPVLPTLHHFPEILIHRIKSRDRRVNDILHPLMYHIALYLYAVALSPLYGGSQEAVELSMVVVECVRVGLEDFFEYFDVLWERVDVNKSYVLEEVPTIRGSQFVVDPVQFGEVWLVGERLRVVFQ